MKPATEVMDPLFQLSVIDRTERPNRAMFLAMKQDYSDDFIMETKRYKGMTEQEMGKEIVEKLLKGGQGHWGVVEHPQIVMNVGYFPHSVVQQSRTHRHLSFDVQSFRYTSKHLAQLGMAFGETQGKLWDHPKLLEQAEQLFYFRPPGIYKGRLGQLFEYDEKERLNDYHKAAMACIDYADKLSRGCEPEQGRDSLPAGYRQHFVMSGNARAIMHFLDLRSKKDAQLEIQKLCNLIFCELQQWIPEVAAYYQEKRLYRAKLSP